MSNAPFEAPSIESISALFPAFDFEGLIAQGGMGAVYKARQRTLDRDVAIKILPRELGDDTAFRTSFVEEAKAMARLLHPNLITVYDSGDVDGLLYIVMEYVPGKSLYYSAHQKAVEPTQAVDIVKGICEGLAEAHENGIVHRDIKPANILLTPKRVPKIGDFGLARAAGHDSEGLAMGTPGYAAPEVINQPELADQRSDIFATGVILHELLTGNPPTDPFELSSEISDAKLLRICRKATHIDPTQRYQSAEEMSDDLKTWALPPAASPRERPSTSRPAVVEESANSSLGRNLAIIVVLLVAIFFAWKGLENKKTATELAKKKHAEEVAETKKKNSETQLAATKPPIDKPATTKTPETTKPVVPEVIPETPAESLIRLREALAEGDFSELPVGTLSKGDSYYFYVSKATKWPEASRMARAFGGHLPLIEDKALLTWAAESIPEDSADGTAQPSTWLGATHAASGIWQLVNGKAWPLESQPQGSGDYAVADRSGTVTAQPASASHPFFIQWQRDGSNPTAHEEILKQCAKTYETGSPVFPPGTQSLGERRFLIIEKSLNYDEALELAKLGGGSLMTLASEEEADWLEKQAKEVEAPKGLWLGATLQDDDLWAWSSYQPWTFARWAPGSQADTGNALIMLPGKGWSSAEDSDQTSGLVIEWSKDQLTEKPTAEADPLDQLAEQARKLLQGHDAKRDKDCAKNAKDYVFKLEVWLKRRGNDAQIAAWTPRVKAATDAVKDDRLPNDIPQGPNEAYPPPLLEIARFHLNKQDSLDLAFTRKALALRDHFVLRLEEAAKAASEIGQRDSALAVSNKIKAAADIDAWIAAILGGTHGNEEARSSSGASGPIIVSAMYGSRGKFADVTELVKATIETEKSSFRVLAKDLGTDPDPGWNKSIRLEFIVDGRTYNKRFGKSAVVSPQALIDFAANNSGQ